MYKILNRIDGAKFAIQFRIYIRFSLDFDYKYIHWYKYRYRLDYISYQKYIIIFGSNLVTKFIVS